MLIKICLVCGKEFVKDQSISVASWHGNQRRPLGVRFCSRSCAAKFNNNGLNTQFKKGQKAINPIRKGQHLSSKTEFKKGNKLSEATKAKMKGRIPWNKGKEFLQIRGENHPQWKGGRTHLCAAIRTMSEYKNWRTKIFKRDKYICQCCKYKIRQLQVHHIIPFYQILNQYNIKSLEDARACSFLWDISNGQTLCVPCHKQTDSYLVNQYTKLKTLLTVT